MRYDHYIFMLITMLSGCSEDISSSHWNLHVIDDSSLGADGVKSMDINRDGQHDLVVGWEQGGLTRVYISESSNGSWPNLQVITVGEAPDVEDAVFIDLDDDGSIDVVSSTEGESRRIIVHWAPAAHQEYTDATLWKTETLYADGTRWMFAVPMDVDGRNGIDLIVGGKRAGAKVGWLESPSNARQVGEWLFHEISAAGWIMSLIIEDMNEDGYPDVLLSDRRGELAGVRWLENPGTDLTKLKKPWRNHWVGARGRQVMFISAADLDGDNVKEIVVPHYTDVDRRLSIFKRGHDSNSDAWSEFRIKYPEKVGQPKSVAVGDIDMDGNPDLVFATEFVYGDRRGIIWLRFNQSPFDSTWQAFDISGSQGTKFDLSQLIDMDGDGDLDVVNTEEHHNAEGGNPGLGLIWYENPVK